MKAVALVSANTHQIRDCVFAPYNASERVLSEKLEKHLGSADLLLQSSVFSLKGAVLSIKTANFS